MIVTGNIIIEPLNANAVRLIGGIEDLVPHYKDGELTSLEVVDERTLNLGDTFRIKTVPYRINKIIQRETTEHEVSFDLVMADRTKTSLFILPMIGGNRRLLFYDSLLINAYIKREKRTNYIVLLYRKSRKKVFKEFIQLIQNLKHFSSLEEPNKHCYVVTFKVPSKYKQNFNMFLNGKYSKFDDEYKLNILDFHRYDIDGRLGEILFKAPRRREQLERQLNAKLPEDSELYSIIDRKKEELQLDKYF